MSLLAQRALGRLVDSNCFDLDGQLVISRLIVERHLSDYLKQTGCKPAEVRNHLQTVFTQAAAALSSQFPILKLEFFGEYIRISFGCLLTVWHRFGQHFG